MTLGPYSYALDPGTISLAAVICGRRTVAHSQNPEAKLLATLHDDRIRLRADRKRLQKQFRRLLAERRAEIASVRRIATASRAARKAK